MTELSKTEEEVVIDDTADKVVRKVGKGRARIVIADKKPKKLTKAQERYLKYHYDMPNSFKDKTDELWHRGQYLLRRKQRIIDEAEEKRVNNEMKALQVKPSISKKSKKLMADNERPADFYTYTTAWKARHDAQLKRAKEAVLKDNASEETFQPEGNLQSERILERRGHHRNVVQHWEAYADEYTRKKKFKSSVDSPFQPKLTERTRLLAEVVDKKRQPAEGINELLYKEGLEHIKKIEEKHIEHVTKFDSPELELNPDPEEDVDFNAMLRQRKKQRREKMKESFDPNLTFSPAISEMSRKMTENREGSVMSYVSSQATEDDDGYPVFESVIDYHERLYEEEKEEKKPKDYNEELTFTPKISKRAKKVKQSFDERLQQNTEKKRELLLRLQQEKEENISKTCTFSPRISKKSKKIAKSFEMSQEKRYLKNLELSKQKKKQMRLERDRQKQAELEQYTFKPAITRKAALIKRSLHDDLVEEEEQVGVLKTPRLKKYAGKDSGFSYLQLHTPQDYVPPKSGKVKSTKKKSVKRKKKAVKRHDTSDSGRYESLQSKVLYKPKNSPIHPNRQPLQYSIDISSPMADRQEQAETPKKPIYVPKDLVDKDHYLSPAIKRSPLAMDMLGRQETDLRTRKQAILAMLEEDEEYKKAKEIEGDVLGMINQWRSSQHV
ncbi:hypothetical protein PCE1_001560 [Barthelona sp. PCE]